MSNLLDELLNLESSKNYSIVLNGIGSFIFIDKKGLKLKKVESECEHLLDFKLKHKKELGEYSVLEFSGETSLSQKEIVQFLLNLIGYKKNKFEAKCVTIGIQKKKKSPATLFALEMKKSNNGEIKRAGLNNAEVWGNVAILGDYFFKNYVEYQNTLQDLVDIWIND